ncbi:hypothetical protein E2I00_006003, partial [Balaenoptera physalus]
TGISHQQGSVLLNEDVFDLLGSLIHEFLVLGHQGFGDGLADWVNLGHETTTVYADTHDHARPRPRVALSEAEAIRVVAFQLPVSPRLLNDNYFCLIKKTITACCRRARIHVTDITFTPQPKAPSSYSPTQQSKTENKIFTKKVIESTSPQEHEFIFVISWDRLLHRDGKMELLDLNRTSVFHSPFGFLDLQTMLLDEYQERLFVGGKDLVYSLSLEHISSDYREAFGTERYARIIHWPSTAVKTEECIMKGKDASECANYVRVLHHYNRTHLLTCGTGAFDPLCAFIRVGYHLEMKHLDRKRTVILCDHFGIENGTPLSNTPALLWYRQLVELPSSELFAGLYSDYWGRDAAIFRSLGRLAHIRTEHDDERLLKEPKFVGSYMIPDNEDRDDNKVYFFFTEKALEAENNAQAIYTRVGRLCVNDVGGQRILVNKWSTFLKARLVCSVPGMNGIDTYFDELEDVFLLHTRDHKNPVIFGLFNTTSNIFRGHAICVYHMSSIRAAFNGPYAHKEGPEYHWSLYEGKVPYPRPGSGKKIHPFVFQCASKVNGGRYGTTKDYPDDAIRFARSHPLMYQPIKPAHKKPILVKTDGKYNLKQIAVDRVEAEDGQYDVLFIGTDNGIVLKVITIYNQETESMEEVILEELQIFKDPVPIISMEISSKRQQLYIGSASAVAQVRFHQCDMYGSACADCCLARDPYCAWDGISCSRYYPTGTHAKRRFRRQDVRHGNAAQQCFGQQFVGDVLDKTEERLAYGIENNSTLLECTPRSLQAKVIWFVQKGHDTRKEEPVVKLKLQHVFGQES